MFNLVGTTPTPVVDFKGKDITAILMVLLKQGCLVQQRGEEWVCIMPSQLAKVQGIIDAYVTPMPNLTPVQFHFLLARFGFDQIIESLLTDLYDEDKDRYAYYKAYITAATYYEFDKALLMFNEIREKFVSVNPALDFSLDQLKSMWMTSKNQFA